VALCVALQADGTLAPTGQTVGECTGYVMVSSAEYGVYQVVQDAMAIPTPEQATDWFVGGFGAVMLFFVVGRMAGSVVAMFKTK
jgi:hypothetical protein